MLGQAKFGSKNFKDCLLFFDMLEIGLRSCLVWLPGCHPGTEKSDRWIRIPLGPQFRGRSIMVSMPPCHGGEGVRIPRSRHMVFFGRALLSEISDIIKSRKDRHIHSRRLLGEELGCHPCKIEGSSPSGSAKCCVIQMAKVGRPSICPERFMGSTPIRSTKFYPKKSKDSSSLVYRV
jgi:hypothetical protein